MAYSQNVIIGAAIGYGDEELHNFLESLRIVGYNGNVHLILADHCEPIDERGLNLTATVVSKTKLEEGNLPASAKRYLFVRDILREFSTHANIMLSDTRDVVFQSDPFDTSLLGTYHLLCPLEEQNIGQCRFNSSWIKARYGLGVHAQLAGYPISCCGTVIGTFRAIADYLSKMCMHLENAINIQGIDQGIHNYILYRDPIEKQALVLNGRGPISTIGYMKSRNITQEGVWLNYDGTIPSVLHQYDRLNREVQMQIKAVTRPAN